MYEAPEKLVKIFTVRFLSLDKIHLTERIVTLFNLETENPDIVSHLLDKTCAWISKRNHCTNVNISVTTGVM